jgi:hypothetical protein
LQQFDGPGGTLGRASYSYWNGLMQDAEIVFDTAEPWASSQDGLVAFGDLYFVTLAIHEIGHAIGLDHYDGSTAVMNSFLADDLHSLTASDRNGALALYGPAQRAGLQANLFFDTDDRSSWSSYTDYVDHQGRVVDEIVIWDSGLGSTYHWDRAGAYGWSDYVDHTDAQGRITGEVVRWDNGLSSGYGWDRSDQFSWSFYADEYDAQGRIHAETLTNDDGTKTGYHWDVASQFGWSTFVDQFDVSGTPISETVYYDDGTVRTYIHDANGWHVA